MRRFFLLGFGLVLPASAQESQTRTVGKEGSAIVGVTPVAPERKVEFRAVVKVAPLRAWKNLKGEIIQAELMSWPLPAGAQMETVDLRKLAFDIVRHGQVQLKKDGQKTFAVALASLSAEDRKFVADLQARITAERALQQ